jgi:hypothetical protein
MKRRTLFRLGLALLAAITFGCQANTTSIGSLSQGVCAATEQRCCTAAGFACLPANTACPLAESACSPTNDAGVADSGATDAGPSCATELAAMLAAPIAPSAHYAGWNLSSGANPKGLTIEEANAAGCGQPFSEAVPSSPGNRIMRWGDGAISAYYNLDSHVISELLLGSAYTGTLSFQSRAGGAYGSHRYSIGVGHVLRDGVEFAVDFSTSPRASAAVDELYDGIMATFASGTAPVADCKSAGVCLALADDRGDYFGARPLHFYVTFDPTSSRPSGFYSFWPGGSADCSTPNANLERMDFAPILPADSTGIGGLKLSAAGANPAGLTRQEADAIECSGVQATAPDPGYGAIHWGPQGEVTLEYNTTTHPDVAYKLIASDGYRGTLTASSADGSHGYLIGVGRLTRDGAPFSIDWVHPAATRTAVTELFNAALSWALYSNTSSSTTADCVASANCTIVADDGHGHSSFEFANGAAALGVVFPQGSATPSAIYTTWASGR